MRPRSILLFDCSYLSARVISVLPELYGLISHRFNANPAPDEPNVIIYAIVIMAIPITLTLFWFFTSIKGSTIAKWIVMAFVTYEALAVVTNWSYFEAENVEFRWVLIVVLTLDVFAVAMLNRTDARAWFKRKRRFGTADPTVFD